MIKRLLFQTTAEKTLLQELPLTGLRMFAGLALALGHGLSKVPPGEQFIGGVGKLGFPMPELFAWLAVGAELGGGLLLAVGLLTRPAAAFIAFTMLVAVFGRHLSDPFVKKELGLLYLFIAVVFLFRGAGRISLDSLIWKGTRKSSKGANR